MQVTNLSYFYEASKKVRGGKWVWVKDSNGEQRGNVLLGGTILNPNKGFGHLWAGQLVQYTPGQGCLIFRSFTVVNVDEATETTFYVDGSGYSDAPEIGQLLMIAPQSETSTGQSTKVTAVSYEEDKERFLVTVDTELEGLSDGVILVEAAGEEVSDEAYVLVPNPNTFIEADRDLLPIEGYGFKNANYSISTVYNKQAWLARMQPLPDYVLEKNRSYIEGIFWI